MAVIMRTNKELNRNSACQAGIEILIINISTLQNWQSNLILVLKFAVYLTAIIMSAQN